MQPRVCFRKILWGVFNQLPRAQIENSLYFPREQIHHTTPKAFQQIIPDKMTVISAEWPELRSEFQAGCDILLCNSVSYLGIWGTKVQGLWGSALGNAACLHS